MHFIECSNLKDVIFEDNSQLSLISPVTFEYCTALTSITIPGNVETIEGLGNGILGSWDGAFEGCSSLKNAIIESGSRLHKIFGNAFFDCTWLSYINLPSSLRTVDYYAFKGCPSTTIYKVPNQSVANLLLHYLSGISSSQITYDNSFLTILSIVKKDD